MLNRLLIITFTLLIAACGAKQKSPTVIGGSSGYKKELEDYERQQVARQASPSLWADVGSHGTIFLDYKARLVGDIIIVKITESASANNSNNTSTSRSSSNNSSVTGLLGLPLNLGISNMLGSGNDFNPSIQSSTSSSFAGKGGKTRSDSISATIAARVVEIMPSGNLVIEGQREIVVDQEKQTITLRGVVRQRDIDANNTVPSTSIADAQISYSGDGIISDANKKGWLASFIDFIWPF